MNGYTRGVLWFNRFVLVAAISVMSRKEAHAQAPILQPLASR
jgi:hypothetical protein